MSRYRTEGIIRDLEAGKRVVLMGFRRDAARHVFLKVADALPPASVGRRALSHGREILETGHGGRLVVLTPEGARGVSTDVLVYVGWDHIHSPDLLGEITDTVLAMQAELIQA